LHKWKFPITRIINVNSLIPGEFKFQESILHPKNCLNLLTNIFQRKNNFYNKLSNFRQRTGIMLKANLKLQNYNSFILQNFLFIVGRKPEFYNIFYNIISFILFRNVIIISHIIHEIYSFKFFFVSILLTYDVW
jgi:hypothetical protein